MSEENKTIVRRYVEEGLNQENLVLFDELLAPNFDGAGSDPTGEIERRFPFRPADGSDGIMASIQG